MFLKCSPRPARAAVLALAFASLAPAAASAGVVTVNNGQMLYQDPAGLSSTLRIERTGLDEFSSGSASKYHIVESGLRSNGSCNAGVNEAFCERVTIQEIQVGAGNDTVQFVDLAPATVSEPQAGRINGGAGNDQLFAGDGNQHVSGDDGNDLVMGGPGADTLIGGTGFDTLSYSNLVAPIVYGGGASTSGPRGEGDTASGFERIVGGFGDDFILNHLAGGGGPLTIQGGGGNDILAGGLDSGNFRRDPNDVLEGGAGNDRLVARDGQRDFLNCGDGLDDSVAVDLFDVVQSNCERVERSPVTAGPNVQIAGSARVRGAAGRVKLTCPRSQRLVDGAKRDGRTKPCAGTIRLGSSRAAFRVPLGRSATVDVPLTAALRRALASRATVRSKATAVERVHPKGPNTTITPITLKG